MKLVFCVVLCVSVLATVSGNDRGIECDRECHTCETLAVPKLRAIHRSCPDCGCARRLINATVPSCPSVHHESFCLQGVEIDDHGCPTTHCKVSENPISKLLMHIQTCRKQCPGGYRVGRDGLPICQCSCPLDRIPVQAKLDFCSEQCLGTGEMGRMVFNPATGCQECFCDSDTCPPFQCDLFCPRGFILDDEGCRTCQCLPSEGCPEPPQCDNDCGAPGRHRDALTGCVTSCECRERPRKPICPPVGCNSDCGPHQLVPVYREECVSGCRCRCQLPKCMDDQTYGVCVERVRDAYGCPTCECAKREESISRRGISLCPDSPFWSPDGSADELCPLSCPASLRLYDGERNCERCECCPDLRKQCPDLDCKENRVDHWGCPVCSCAESRVH